jgi:hypothetical protein
MMLITVQKQPQLWIRNTWQGILAGQRATAKKE